MNRLLLLSLVIMFFVGCGSNESPKPAEPPQSPVASPLPPPPPPPTMPPKLPAAKDSDTNAKAPDVNVQETPQQPGTVLEEAKQGVGEKGRGYGGGITTTPVAAYFSTKERIAFQIQIPQAMQLFKATEDRAPKSQEEFMQRIIKENQIQLPELPKGHRYLYDPKTEQLMVERPAG